MCVKKGSIPKLSLKRAQPVKNQRVQISGLPVKSKARFACKSDCERVKWHDKISQHHLSARAKRAILVALVHENAHSL
jgi:hypothetical protein